MRMRPGNPSVPSRTAFRAASSRSDQAERRSKPRSWSARSSARESRPGRRGMPPRPRMASPPRAGEIGVGHQPIAVDGDPPAEPVALRAGAVRRVEREEARLQLGDAQAAARAGEPGAEGLLPLGAGLPPGGGAGARAVPLVPRDHGRHQAAAQLQAALHALGEAGPRPGDGAQPVVDHLDRVELVAREPGGLLPVEPGRHAGRRCAAGRVPPRRASSSPRGTPPSSGAPPARRGGAAVPGTPPGAGRRSGRPSAIRWQCRIAGSGGCPAGRRGAGGGRGSR